jgi:hypothetical protein
MSKQPSLLPNHHDDDADGRIEKQRFMESAIDLDSSPPRIHIRRARRMRPSRCTAGQLRRVGVNLVDEHRLMLGCEECGQRWSPNILGGGKMPRGYWKCPQGCNAEVEHQSQPSSD